jgi:hypothetical protein
LEEIMNDLPGQSAEPSAGNLKDNDGHERSGAPSPAGAINIADLPSAKQPPYGAYVTVCGVLAITAVGIVAMLHYGSASQAVAVLSPLTGVIAALVGTYFGVRSTALAQQKANEEKAIDRANVVGPSRSDEGPARRERRGLASRTRRRRPKGPG